MGSFREIDPTQFARYFLDVPYADEDPRQVMDVWLPNEGEGPFPLIVFVHGGGWVSGNKRENTMPGVFKFPSQGYAVACVEYRLVPDVHWPEPLEDVRAAIRYLLRMRPNTIWMLKTSPSWAIPQVGTLPAW